MHVPTSTINYVEDCFVSISVRIDAQTTASMYISYRCVCMFLHLPLITVEDCFVSISVRIDAQTTASMYISYRCVCMFLHLPLIT